MNIVVGRTGFIFMSRNFTITKSKNKKVFWAEYANNLDFYLINDTDLVGGVGGVSFTFLLVCCVHCVMIVEVKLATFPSLFLTRATADSVSFEFLWHTSDNFARAAASLCCGLKNVDSSMIMRLTQTTGSARTRSDTKHGSNKCKRVNRILHIKHSLADGYMMDAGFPSFLCIYKHYQHTPFNMPTLHLLNIYLHR